MHVRPSFVVAAVALLATATLVATWPLFAHPATTVLDTPVLYGDASVFVQRDINLTMWILAWDTHALTTDPLRLFHANAFYPTPYGLALSEHMLGNVPLFAPVYLATGNPVLAHQTTLAATFVLAGLAMAAYVHHWTRDPVAALAAGFFFAFAPYRLWQLGNLHVISIHWLPLVPLGIDLALDGRRRAGGAMLAGALVAATCCSYYVGYAAFALAGAYAAVSLAGRRHDLPRAVGALALPVGVAAGVVALVTVPYLILQRAGIILPGSVQAGVDDIAFVAASSGPARFLGFLVTPRRDEIPQFLGYTVVALAAAALALHRRRPRGALLAVGITGFVLALGPSLTLPGGRQVTLPYAYLQAAVPGFATMRVPQRFGALMTLAATALGGLGVAAVRARIAAHGYRRSADWLAAALVVVALVEARTPGLRAVDVPVGPSIPPSTAGSPRMATAAR